MSDLQNISSTITFFYYKNTIIKISSSQRNFTAT